MGGGRAGEAGDGMRMSRAVGARVGEAGGWAGCAGGARAVGTSSLKTSLKVGLLKFLTKFIPLRILPSKIENTIKITVTII